jgi:hypothetical protein
VESGVTEFSPEIRCIQEAAQHLLSDARRYRKNRYWALPPADVRPALPEGGVWSDNKEDVQAFLVSTAHSQRRMRAWWRCGVRPFAFSIDSPWLDGVLEWPNDEECLPPSERRIRKHLASGVHGALNYRIWMSSAGDGQRQQTLWAVALENDQAAIEVGGHTPLCPCYITGTEDAERYRAYTTSDPHTAVPYQLTCQ